MATDSEDFGDLNPNSPADMTAFVRAVMDGNGWISAQAVPVSPLFAESRAAPGAPISLEIKFGVVDYVYTDLQVAIVHFPSGDIIQAPVTANERLPLVVKQVDAGWNRGGYFLIAENQNGRPWTAEDLVPVEQVNAHPAEWTPPNTGGAVVTEAVNTAAKAAGASSVFLLALGLIVAWIYLAGPPAKS